VTDTWKDRVISSDLFEVDKAGHARHIATLNGLRGITARLSTTADRLLATTTTDGIDAVCAFSLKDGSRVTIVPNDIEGITFGGYAPMRDGSLLYMRKEINYNVWLFDFRPDSSRSTAQGGR